MTGSVSPSSFGEGDREEPFSRAHENGRIPILCPRCGKEMIRKMNRDTEETFWGHKEYCPEECRASYRSLEELERDRNRRQRERDAGQKEREKEHYFKVELFNINQENVDLLDDKTKVIMDYRLKYPESSYQELASIIAMETGYTIGKSGINHHFIKIKKLRETHENKKN